MKHSPQMGGVTDGTVRHVDIWYQSTEYLSEPEMARAIELLSPDERARCDRFVFEKDRRDFASAHALLRSALSMREGSPPSFWTFLVGSRGKPFLAPNQSTLGFNIAHTNGLVAIALAELGSVGIDVESIDRAVDSLAIAQHYFSERELLALLECRGIHRQTRFIELWTLKEAYLKAIGTGLSDSLSDCCFAMPGEAGLQFDSPSERMPPDWHFALFAPSERYRMAVAVKSERSVIFSARGWSFDRVGKTAAPLRLSSVVRAAAENAEFKPPD